MCVWCESRDRAPLVIAAAPVGPCPRLVSELRGRLRRHCGLGDAANGASGALGASLFGCAFALVAPSSSQSFFCSKRLRASSAPAHNAKRFRRPHFQKRPTHCPAHSPTRTARAGVASSIPTPKKSQPNPAAMPVAVNKPLYAKPFFRETLKREEIQVGRLEGRAGRAREARCA